MSAVFPVRGPVRRLDHDSPQRDQISKDDVENPAQLSRVLNAILKEIIAQRGKWNPGHFDFEDVVVDGTGTTKYRLEHKLGVRVRFWVVDWVGAAAPCLSRDASTTLNTLVFVSRVAGTMTLRIESAG